MRYFEFTLKIKSEEIRSETVRLKDYSYDNPVEALTSYLFKNLSNGNSFLIYREEESGLKSVFAIDEKTRKPDEAFGEIMLSIEYVIGSKIKTDDPVEITMLDFDQKMIEAKRRGFTQYWSRIVDQAGVLIYDDRESLLTGRCGFKLNEAVAQKCGSDSGKKGFFDKTLSDELRRIRTAPPSSKDIRAFPAHYVIAAKSKAAGSDLTATLTNALHKAGRLYSGRIEFFSEIDVDLYRHPSLFEKVIENSYGGTIVIDMTDKFAEDPSSYGITCSYLVKTVRQHKNDNLFVFLYNMDEPGFAFTLMSMFGSSLYFIKIREGNGNTDSAEKYLKFLIRNSEFSRFEDQAGEFLTTLHKSEFTQTDIIEAFENFESWAMRKNLLKSYKLDASGDFSIERDTDCKNSYERLQGLIGLKSVKEQIDRIILANKAELQRKNLGGKGRAMHMVFAGNPGTAKTTVAELFAGIAKESGILKSGIFVERSGMELSGFMSGTRVRQAFDQAMGGVLFIDEAYSLFGDGAVTELIRQMETKRNDVIVIFAGYKDRMKSFLELNEGLRSRIPYNVDFPDYNPSELIRIFDHILEKDGFTATPGARSAALEIFGKAYRIENFGNGRYARNLVEKATLNLSVRLARKYGDNIPEDKLFKLTKDDLYIPNDPVVNTNNGEKKKGRKEALKPARERLAEMIGLESAKTVIDRAVATFKMQKLLRKKGVDIGHNTMHMVFTGNPGTAKTTTARLVAEILKEEGVLSTGAFVEAGRADLIGQYVGQTAPKVRKKFRDAMGGVLFIDEAYSLNEGIRGSYGDEAINTIVQEMDNRKDDMIVIFAGYPDEMKEFIGRNPGMSSRIALRVNFEDYSPDELIGITRFHVEQKHLHITEEALDKLRPIYEAASRDKTFGNGRYVRRAVELAISNLAVRIEKLGGKNLPTGILTTITAEDIAAPTLDDTAKPKRKIGFAA